MPHCNMLKMLIAILLYANNPIATLLYVIKQYAPTTIAQRPFFKVLAKLDIL